MLPGPSALDDADALVAGDERRRGLTGHSPRAAWMSVWQSPQASMRTSTCSAPGLGIGHVLDLERAVEAADDGGLHAGTSVGVIVVGGAEAVSRNVSVKRSTASQSVNSNSVLVSVGWPWWAAMSRRTMRVGRS